MIIPEREILRRIVAALTSQRLDENDAAPYARRVLAVIQDMDVEQASAAFLYILRISVEALQEYHGAPEPERGEIVIMRFHLGILKDRADQGNLPLTGSQIELLSRVLGTEPSYFPSNSRTVQRPSFDSGTAKRPAQESVPPRRPSVDAVPVSRPSFDSGAIQRPSFDSVGAQRPSMSSVSKLDVPQRTTRSGEFPIAPVSSTAWAQPREEAAEFDVLGRPIKRADARYYFFSAVTLSAAFFMTFEAFEINIPLWQKAVISVGVPLSVIGIVAVSKSLVLLRYLRTILIWGSISALAISGVGYGYAMYRRAVTYAAIEKVDRAFSGISVAMDRYRTAEKIYPRSLDELFEEESYTKDTSLRAPTDLIDPFNRMKSYYLYTRTLDAYLVQSVGPEEEQIDLSLPATISPPFLRELTNLSYDPTNGLYTGGNIIYLGRRAAR